jgi:hypothetical protein
MGLSFLTSLGSIANQVGDAGNAAREDKQARVEKLKQMDVQDAYLQIAKQADQRAQESHQQDIDRGDLLPLNGGYWSISKGRIVTPPRPNPIDALREFGDQTLDPDTKKRAENAAQASFRADPDHPDKAIGAYLKIADEAHKKIQGTKTGTVDPIIIAQIGKPPDPASFPKGDQDPAYQAKAKQWGVRAETVKERMANSSAEARGKAYGEYRPGAFITPEGETVSDFYGDAISKGYTPFAPGFQAMSRNVQIGEMQSASGKLRSAINALEPEDAFTPEAVLQLKRASATDDPKVFSAMIDNALAASLNDRQQDYLVWLQQMGERVLSLRNVAGMGAGAQDLRAAIQSTLPGLTSGTKQLALKRLDAVDNQVNILGRGIPKTNINTQSAVTPPPGATIIKWGDVK